MNNFDLQKLIDRLLVKYPAFASTIVNIGYYEKPVSTLCTDGQNIYYNKDYLNKLSFNEQLFTFAHEICHIRSNHILRSKGKNHKLWNIATDAVINQLLKIENMTFYGRGGTNFDVAINAFSQRVDNKIIFTDGYADMPKDKSNVIWIVFGDEKINPLGGKVIYIDKQTLKQGDLSNHSIRK